MTTFIVTAALKLSIIVSQFRGSLSESFKVVSPEASVIVSWGETAVLPCHLSPSTSAKDMTVRWFRSKFSFTVHLYQNGKSIDYQISEYQGRTELDTSLISNGEVSLSIHNITASDEGWYTCLFQSVTFYDAADLQLKVSAFGSDPYIYVEDNHDGSLRAVCKSNGWYPRPEVLWRDHNEYSIQSSAEVQVQNGEGLFDIEILLLLNATSINKVSCVIRHSVLEQEKKSTIYISETMFLRVSRCGISRILILVSFTLVMFCVISGALYFYMTQKKENGKLVDENKQLLEENETLSENVGNVSEENKKLLDENETLLNKIENLSAEMEWRKRCSYKVPVSLDPETAHPLLILSEDLRHVQHGSIEQDLPDNPERFTTNPCVLGSEGFTAGRHYWEAEVLLDGGGWDLGAAKESVRKKGWIRLSPKEGIWAMRLGRDQYQALTAPYSTHVPIRDRARRMGVYLDYEEGQLTFFNVDTMKLIYTFNDTFTEKIYPFFNVWYEGLEIKL
ncbi:hypothetical protein FKM82_015972 [Ascaphus truei]